MVCSESIGKATSVYAHLAKALSKNKCLGIFIKALNMRSLDIPFCLSVVTNLDRRPLWVYVSLN